MGDRRQAGTESPYVTNHPGEFSLANPLAAGAMSTGKKLCHALP